MNTKCLYSTTIGYLLSFLGYGYLLCSIFSLLFATSTVNLSQSFFLCGFMTLTTPTQQAFNDQGSPTSKCSAWLKISYSLGNSAPTRGEEWFLCLFVLTRWEMVLPMPTKVVLTSQCAKHVMTMPVHLSLFQLFCYRKTYSQKWIVPTDNIWPKSDNAKRVMGV